jgi:protein TonB
MSVAERHLNSTFPSDELDFVLEQVRAGNYADALQALARAKADDQRNIFLMALEKQVTRLRVGGVLPRERSEIIDSLSGLVDRARSGRQARPEGSGRAPSQGTPAPLPAGERKDPRLKVVAEQYLRHADEWVKKRDFEAALKEIERVLLIDPENRAAKEYQSRVQALFRIEQHEPDAVAPAPAMEPAPVVDGVVGETPGSKKLSRPVLVLVSCIVLLVIVIGGILFLRPKQGQYRVGYMYVSPAPLAVEEAQPVTAAETGTSVAEQPLESAPVVKPPETAKPAEKQTSKPAAREQAVEKEQVADKQPAAEPEPPKVAPSTSAPAQAAPSAIAEKERTSEEPTATTQFIPVEQPPKIVQLQQPSFSEEQILQGVQGDVVVKVQIDKTGKPLQAKVISSTNSALNGAVIEAVMRSSYAPGVMSSGPVTTWMTIPLKLK